jgi:hypothetical protein
MGIAKIMVAAVHLTGGAAPLDAAHQVTPGATCWTIFANPVHRDAVVL